MHSDISTPYDLLELFVTYYTPLLNAIVGEVGRQGAPSRGVTIDAWRCVLYDACTMMKSMDGWHMLIQYSIPLIACTGVLNVAPDSGGYFCTNGGDGVCCWGWGLVGWISISVPFCSGWLRMLGSPMASPAVLRRLRSTLMSLVRPPAR